MVAQETSVTPMGARTLASYRGTTRLRLTKLRLAFGDKLDAALATCKSDEQREQYLDLLCMMWFGPLEKAENRTPRSDKGGWHWLPERVWSLTCEQCGHNFEASRWDARFCRNACRQAAYRQRRRDQ